MIRTLAKGAEPTIAVGLVDGADALIFHLDGVFCDQNGARFEGEQRAHFDGSIVLSGASVRSESLSLTPLDGGCFRIETTIGIDFHWEQKETQIFSGGLRIVPREGKLVAINEVPLETYLTSVICSEMSASSPPALLRAHAIISRSWLMAQVTGSIEGEAPTDPTAEERIVWYDREAHELFDVCADDHCQRYQGETRISSGVVFEAIAATRGKVLLFDDRICDARFSKCCGGVVEAFASAWQDVEVPYLVPLFDGEGPIPELTNEEAVRDFLSQPVDAYCCCDDPAILDAILPAYDRSTPFFRWEVSIGAEEAGALAQEKLGIDLGRLTALRPISRGPSGRLTRLLFVGEKGQLVVGKELEIRRALSKTHLFSSAFVVDTAGPERFLLKGAGWGHGVGLCQIGAAVMATKGKSHEEILAHYYPGASLESWYS